MKKWLTPIAIGLMLLICCIVFSDKISTLINRYELLEPEEVSDCIQSVYGMVKWQELMDKYDLEYDKNVIEDMKSKYISIMKKTDIDNMAITELTRFIYINSKWDIEEFAKYNTYLGEYYNSERKLFYNYKIDELEEEAIENLYGQAMSYSCQVCRTLKDVDVYKDNFDVSDGLRKYYQICEDSLYRGNIIYTLFAAGKLDTIDYMKEKDYFQNLCDDWVASYKEGNAEVTLSDLDANDFLIICNKMGIDTSELETYLSEFVVDYTDDELLFPADITSLTYPLYVTITYFDMLYYDYEYKYLEMNDILADKLVKNYSEFYYNTLSGYLDEMENLNK